MNIRRRATLVILSGMMVMICLGGLLIYHFLVVNQERDYLYRYLTISDLVSEQIIEAERITSIVMYNGLTSIQAKISKNNFNKEDLKEMARKANLTHLFIIDKKGKFIASSNESPNEIPNLFSFSPEYKKLFRDRSLKYLSSPIIPPFPEVIPFKFMTIALNKDFLLEGGLRIDFIGSILDKTTRIDPGIRSIRIITPDGVDLGDMKTSISKYTRQVLRDINTTRDGVLSSDSKAMLLGHKIKFNAQNCAQCGPENKHFYYFEMEVSKDRLNVLIASLRIRFLFGVVLAIMLSIGTAYFISKRLVTGIELITKEIALIASHTNYSSRLSCFREKEINDLSKNFNTLMDELEKQKMVALELEKQAVLSSVASQVSHDIKSPLSALKMIIEKIDGLEEGPRLLIKNAVQRINDIANDLLSKGKGSVPNLNSSTNKIKKETVLLSAAVEGILSEKRIQYQNFAKIKILSDLSTANAFIAINCNELLRILSNLIDNAVESLMDERGTVAIAIREFQSSIHLVIKDEGRGIPDHILSKLGSECISFGKDKQGNGLGVLHAKKTLEASGATMTILSKITAGTIVTIKFEKAPTPTWFADQIKFSKHANVMSLDDDLSVHGIWNCRFANMVEDKIVTSVVNFTKGQNFIESVKKLNPEVRNRSIFLVDFELLNEYKSGLDLIEELGLSRNSILVTNRYEEQEIQQRCEKLNLKILPKILAGLVPLNCEKI